MCTDSHTICTYMCVCPDSGPQIMIIDLTLGSWYCAAVQHILTCLIFREQGNCCWFSYCSMAYGGPSAIWLQVCIVDRFYVIFPRFSVFIAWLLLVHISLLPYLLLVYIYIYMYIHTNFFLFHSKVYFRILNASSLCVFALAICTPPSTSLFPPSESPT